MRTSPSTDTSMMLVSKPRQGFGGMLAREGRQRLAGQADFAVPGQREPQACKACDEHYSRDGRRDGASARLHFRPPYPNTIYLANLLHGPMPNV